MWEEGGRGGRGDGAKRGGRREERRGEGGEEREGREEGVYLGLLGLGLRDKERLSMALSISDCSNSSWQCVSATSFILREDTESCRAVSFTSNSRIDFCKSTCAHVTHTTITHIAHHLRPA